MSNRRTIIIAGTYERDYPRNQQMIRLLQLLGWNVIEIHQPFWERIRDKSRLGGVIPLLAMSLTLFLIYIRLTLRLMLKIRHADAIAVGYIGQIDMLVLGTTARLFRKPVIFNPLVTLTDTVVEDRAMTEAGSGKASVIRLLDRVSLSLAHCVISDTEQNAEYMSEKTGVPRSRINTVLVGADEGVFRQGHIGSGKPGLHVLFYGKMIPLHGVETILSALKHLNKSGETDISFEIIGTGQQESLVTTALRDAPHLPVTYRPWVAYPRLAQRIACADVVLGIFGMSDKAARVIPNKVFQAMAVGAPIITRDSPAVRSVLEHEHSALLVPAGDPEALADGVRALRDDDLRSRIGTGALEAFQRSGTDASTSKQLQFALESAGLIDPRDGTCG